MDLHGQIMNIQSNKRDQNKAIDEAMKTWRTYNEILVAVYQRGHRDARHAAAELATIQQQVQLDSPIGSQVKPMLCRKAGSEE